MGLIDFLFGVSQSSKDPSARLNLSAAEERDIEVSSSNAVEHMQLTVQAKFDIQKVVYEHIEILYRKKKQLVIKDDYGKADERAWHRERQYFIEKVLTVDPTVARNDQRFLQLERNMSPLTSSERFMDRQKRLQPERIIERSLIEYERGRLVKKPSTEASTDTEASSMTPLEFENHCATVLTGYGWSARRTRSTGDQGVDIIATRGPKKVVLQCKQYSNPVGNKAVQEVMAGMVFEGADHAVVVTSSTFTDAARQLAEAGNVLLLHVSELHEIDQRLASRDR